MRGPILIALAATAYCLAQDGQSNALRDQYNRTYASPDEQPTFNHEPNAFLTTVLGDIKPGKALDVGMGQGRNALWLAKRGWDVTGFDLSDVGVRVAKQRADAAGLHLNATVSSAQDFDFGVNRWDLIVLTYVPFHSYRDKLIDALRPGGLILVEGFHNDTRRVRLLGDGFQNNELLQAFTGLRVLKYEDVWAKQDWGAQLDGPNRLVRLLAQKPAPPEKNCELNRTTYESGREVCWGVLKLSCAPQGWERIGACPAK